MVICNSSNGKRIHQLLHIIKEKEFFPALSLSTAFSFASLVVTLLLVKQNMHMHTHTQMKIKLVYKTCFQDTGHQAQKQWFLKDTDKVRLISPNLLPPGCNTGWGTQADPNGLLELKSWIWESWIWEEQEVRVLRTEYWRQESCRELDPWSC